MTLTEAKQGSFVADSPKSNTIFIQIRFLCIKDDGILSAPNKWVHAPLQIPSILIE